MVVVVDENNRNVEKQKRNVGKVKKKIFAAERASLHSFSFNISEFTQQGGRKKRTAKRLRVTNVTGLLFTCFVVIFT